MPLASLKNTTWAPRAATSCKLEAVFSKSASGGAMTITGTSLSMSAIGPCLSSPAAKPSAWMYASSLSLRAPSSATG